MGLTAFQIGQVLQQVDGKYDMLSMFAAKVDVYRVQNSVIDVTHGFSNLRRSQSLSLEIK